MNIKTLKMLSADQSEDIKKLDNSLGAVSYTHLRAHET